MLLVIGGDSDKAIDQSIFCSTCSMQSSRSRSCSRANRHRFVHLPTSRRTRADTRSSNTQTPNSRKASLSMELAARKVRASVSESQSRRSTPAARTHSGLFSWSHSSSIPKSDFALLEKQGRAGLGRCEGASSCELPELHLVRSSSSIADARTTSRSVSLSSSRPTRITVTFTSSPSSARQQWFSMRGCGWEGECAGRASRRAWQVMRRGSPARARWRCAAGGGRGARKAEVMKIYQQKSHRKMARVDSWENLICRAKSGVVVGDGERGGQVELLDQALHRTLKLEVAVQLEEGAVVRAQVVGVGESSQVVLQGAQFVVVLALEVGEDGHAVVELEGVGVGGVVHQQHVAQVAPEDAQVLDEVALVGDEAVLAVEAVVDELARGVQEVQDLVGVAGVAGREHHHLEPPAQALQQLHRPRPDVDARLRLLARGELDGDAQVVLGGHGLVAVDERLVQVEDDGAPALRARLPLQAQQLRFQLVLTGHLGVLERLEYLEALGEVFARGRGGVAVGLEHLGDVVGGTARRVGVHQRLPHRLALRHLDHQPLQRVLPELGRSVRPGLLLELQFPQLGLALLQEQLLAGSAPAVGEELEVVDAPLDGLDAPHRHRHFRVRVVLDIHMIIDQFEWRPTRRRPGQLPGGARGRARDGQIRRC